MGGAAELLKVLVWLTPAAIVDEGGQRQTQPAYLNFDISIEGPPSGNRMQVGYDSLCVFERSSLLHSCCLLHILHLQYPCTCKRIHLHAPRASWVRPTPERLPGRRL